MEALDKLSKKIDTLLKKHAAVVSENNRLRDTVDAQSRKMEQLEKKLNSLDQGLVSVHLGRDSVNEEDKDNMRRQLDTVIDEIDKILNTLND